MKILALILTLLSFNLSAHHCTIEFPEVGLCGAIKWTTGPVLDEKSAFTLTFWDINDHNQSAKSPVQDIDVYSWMVMHHGHSHGGPLFAYEEITPGVFHIDEARFFMGGMQGHWEIRIDLVEQGKVISNAKVMVPLK